MIEKVDRLEDQNKTIAEGLVAIADMVRDMKGEKPKHKEPKPFKAPEPLKEPFKHLYPPIRVDSRPLIIC